MNLLRAPQVRAYRDAGRGSRRLPTCGTEEPCPPPFSPPQPPILCKAFVPLRFMPRIPSGVLRHIIIFAHFAGAGRKTSQVGWITHACRFSKFKLQGILFKLLASLCVPKLGRKFDQLRGMKVLMKRRINEILDTSRGRDLRQGGLNEGIGISSRWRRFLRNNVPDLSRPRYNLETV